MGAGCVDASGTPPERARARNAAGEWWRGVVEGRGGGAHLGGVEPEGADGVRCRVGEEEGDTAIEGHGRVELVVIDIERVHPVRVRVPRLGAGRRRQVEGRRVLGKAVDVLGALVSHVHAD